MFVVVAWLAGRMTTAPAFIGDSAYQSLVSARTVSRVADNLGPVTRIKLTPDELLMFVTNLNGEVFVLAKDGDQYIKQDTPVYKVRTGFVLGEENGMTGLVVSQNFSVNHYIFLTYAQREGSVGRNRILRLTVEKQGEVYVGTEPKVIFTGNTPVLGAHQIQGGVSVMIESQPHLLFAVGEAYHPGYAQDLGREAGKLMLITEDGDNPYGARPWPQYPKLQAIGIRNVYDLSVDPQTNWLYFTDNGPDSNDTIIHAPVLDGTRQFDFNWHNNADDLLNPLENGQPHPEYVVYHWPVTVAPTDIAADNIGRFYFNIFSSVREPQKELVMGKLNGQGIAALQTIANRRPDVAGGNLLGLALSDNGSIYFGDFLDGAIYRFGRL